MTSYGAADTGEIENDLSFQAHYEGGERDHPSPAKRGRVWAGVSVVLLILAGVLMYSTPSFPQSSSKTSEISLKATTRQTAEVEKKHEAFRAKAKAHRLEGLGSDGKTVRKAQTDRYSFSALDVVKLKANGNAKELMKLFNEFAQKENREYKDLADDHETKQSRFATFVENLENTAKKQKALDSNTEKKNQATYGVNKFADMTAAEKRSLLSFNKEALEQNKEKLATMGAKFENKQVAKYTGTDLSVDWTGSLATTYIIDQGLCGCCWAVSATEQMESDSIAQGISTIDDWFSTEYTTACDSSNWGCGGGNTETAWYWMYMSGGMMLASDYGDGDVLQSRGAFARACVVDEDAEMVSKPVAYGTLSSEEQMKEYVLSTGPLSICYAAEDVLDYTGGIMTSCSGDIDHCSQIVGFNGEAETPYWIVRNSWGSWWGESGYFYIAYGSDLCDITYDPHYLEVEAV